MPDKHFIAKAGSPFHISVGAVLVNDKGQIACHHIETYHTIHDGELKDLYALMRESLEDNETLEDCLARGLREEFGASGQLDRYLGTVVSHFTPSSGIPVEKTTLYFLVYLEKIDANLRDKDDPEYQFATVWKTPAELIKKMEDQANRYPQRTDLNEAKIITAYLATIKEVT